MVFVAVCFPSSSLTSSQSIIIAKNDAIFAIRKVFGGGVESTSAGVGGRVERRKLYVLVLNIKPRMMTKIVKFFNFCSPILISVILPGFSDAIKIFFTFMRLKLFQQIQQYRRSILISYQWILGVIFQLFFCQYQKFRLY